MKFLANLISMILAVAAFWHSDTEFQYTLSASLVFAMLAPLLPEKR